MARPTSPSPPSPPTSSRPRRQRQRRRRGSSDSDIENAPQEREEEIPDYVEVVEDEEGEKQSRAPSSKRRFDTEESNWKNAWRRLLPILAYHHVLMFILVLAVVAWSLLLAGCSSSLGSIPDIYLLSLSYNTATSNSNTSVGYTRQYLDLLQNVSRNTRLEVRAGFFASCVKIPTLIQGQADWDCDDVSSLVSRYGEEVDPLGLVQFASDFSSKIEFYGLIIGVIVIIAVAFILFSTFPGWHTVDDDGSIQEVKPFPSRAVSNAALVALSFASLFGIISILWLHVGAVAATELLDSVFGTLVSTRLGAAALSLGWIAVFLTILVFLGDLVMLLSIQLLDRLTEDDDDGSWT